MAEDRALRDGIQEAITAGDRNMDVEGDNLSIIQAVQGKVIVRRQLRNVMLDIQTWINQCANVEVRHI